MTEYDTHSMTYGDQHPTQDRTARDRQRYGLYPVSNEKAEFGSDINRKHDPEGPELTSDETRNTTIKTDISDTLAGHFTRHLQVILLDWGPIMSQKMSKLYGREPSVRE